ncbi:Hypothetical protein A7982_01462 [Minicystis rosea]|nr:Hypothetical protein A7982_01462 [Minicystis rosea]
MATSAIRIKAILHRSSAALYQGFAAARINPPSTPAPASES